MRFKKINKIVIIILLLVVIGAVIPPPQYDRGDYDTGYDYMEALRLYNYITRLLVLACVSLLSILWFFSHNVDYYNR